MKNGMVECSVCHSKLVSPTSKTVSRAYDRYKTRVSSKQRALNVILVVGDCILVGLQPILVYMSKVDGSFKFSPISVNFLTEVAKLIFAIVMLLLQARHQKVGEKPLLSISTFVQAARNNVLLAIPALLYAINNYLKFTMQLYFNPSTVKMLSNMKVLVIAVLLKIIMRRRFSIIQWEALALLLIGISVNQLRSLPEGSTALGLPVATGAYICTLIFVTVPSLASVYNEYALKSQYDTSIYLQNLFLYGYGAIFNFLGILGTVIIKGPSSFDILQGHSKATMLLIANNAAQGILSSFFFKYADTILKKYSSTVATIFTGIASAALFGHTLTMNFLLGISIVFISICKVFHGADNDVLWLERDFHIYVVNLFDTAKACEVLSKPQKSLAYLLETYCGVSTNKLLQREDWRQRPLSKEMVQYARIDAHYLLYIANCLITELKQQDTEISCPDDKSNFVLEASRRSNMICLQLYTKEVEAFPGESAASSLSSRHLNSQGGVSSISCKTQFQDLVRRLCAWRDLMARVHDESLRYVLSDQAIVALADRAPMTPTEVFSTITQADLNVELSFNSFLLSPSPAVCSHLDDVCSLLQDKIGNFNDIFPMILQKCLGPGGSCPLSILNYALLFNCNLKVTVASKQNGERSSRQAARKSSRDLFVQKFSCKSPVYHNCRIYANDGRLLCYCDRRKLEWYLLRDLAKLVDENPPAIMLLFEPKGRPEDEDNDFYIQSKKNICVGCGEGNHYLRYRIIPSCYRIHFPEHLKSHRSHDIVLLCVDCHEVSHAAAEKYKKQVAAEFGIPLFVSKVVDSKQAQVISGSSESAMNLEEAGVSPLQLRTAAMALLRHGPRMPLKRREELKQIVMSYYGGREITEVDLEMALLVGMNPQERRRLEKKKRLPFKHSAGSILPYVEHENNIGCMETSSIVDTSELSTLDGSHSAEVKACSRKEDRETDTDVGVDGEVSSTKENVISDENGVSDTKGVHVVNSDDNCESRGPSDGTVDSYYTKSDGTAQHKHNSKLSLLGHGPHGKQVVDHLQKEYGDDGIREFCQRWRQVFVEAVHPRFLPAGWDVMHSGRRDFGEYSVYNPAKKASATGKD